MGKGAHIKESRGGSVAIASELLPATGQERRRAGEQEEGAGGRSKRKRERVAEQRENSTPPLQSR